MGTHETATGGRPGARQGRVLAALPVRHAACSPATQPPKEASPMSLVLIVDDVQTDRTLIGKVVSESGHQPLYAANGKEALQAARMHRPSLILLDVVMPDVNGFNVCRTLKNTAETSEIPVVLVTTKGTDSDRFWGRKQGAEDHLAKPFAAEELTAVIRRFVR
jgi:CheY-like chemotaxis protein